MVHQTHMRGIEPRRGVHITLLVLMTMVAVAAPLAGQQPEDTWDVTKPRGETREVSFEVDEGTWTSVDISPDATWLVFDLVGHIYRLPIAGGDAMALTQDSGIAMNYHPRISPDGEEIAFVSDRGGQDNLWIMSADGSNTRLVHGDVNYRVAEPAWTPDGRHIVVTKREKSPTGFYRTYDVIWSFPREGGAGFEVVRLTSSGGAAPARSGVWSGLDRAQWPSVSPDGQYIYFHSSIFAGGDRRLQRIHRDTGRIENVTEGKNRYLSCCGRPAYPLRLGEVAPEISPDGRWLAFARKLPGGRTAYRGKEYMGRTTLWLRDLDTGDERIVMDPISNTLAEHHPSWHVRVLPGYNWANDGKSIVISQGGKIRRLWVESGQVETIPFRARIHRIISQSARGQVRIEGDTFQARILRWPASSPDGTQIVFEATGLLWSQTLPSGVPQPLTDSPGEVFQLTPAWSRDGQWVAFVTWQDGVGGHLWKVPRSGGRPQRLTVRPGTYLHPNWSDDGAAIYLSQWPPALTPDWDTHQWQLMRVSAEGGELEQVTPPGLPAHTVMGSDQRLYYFSQRKLQSVSGRTGEERREHVQISGRAQEAIPSPGGQWVAVEYEEDVYLARLPRRARAGHLVELDLERMGKRLSTKGGYFARWRDGETLEFVAGNTYFVHNVASGQTEPQSIELRLQRNTASGSIALTGARIITLDNGSVEEQATVVARDGRIRCVGECDVSGVDRILDLSGKTIVPGWVDVHAHHLAEDGRTGIVPQHRSTSARYLGYGITTTHDPSARPIQSFAIGEMIEAGRIMGPRSYSTGPSLTCGPWSPLRKIRTFEDAQDHVDRLANLGAISIKDYKQCTRLQRTWLAEAARRRGVTLTSEGSDMEYFLGLIMTGHAGWEHPLQYVPVYSDVTNFFGRSGAHYSAQLLMSDYPTGNAIEYWMGEADLWLDDKLLRWSPWQETATRRSFVKKPLREFMFPILAEGAADIKRAGGHLAVGAHGEQDGLGTHWEVWAYGQAVTPMEALEAASYGGAHFLGMEQEIGSIEPGKLADLVVLRSNPLDDIRNTTDIQYVMKSGRLYDAETLDEIWPQARPYGVQPWVSEDVLRRDLRRDDHHDATARPESPGGNP